MYFRIYYQNKLQGGIFAFFTLQQPLFPCPPSPGKVGSDEGPELLSEVLDWPQLSSEGEAQQSLPGVGDQAVPRCGVLTQRLLNTGNLITERQITGVHRATQVKVDLNKKVNILIEVAPLLTDLSRFDRGGGELRRSERERRAEREETDGAGGVEPAGGTQQSY